MTEQPEALRLADRLERTVSNGWILHLNEMGDMAAELRRLAAVEQEVIRLKAELSEWEKLRDPATLHANLLRGLPAQLDSATFLHLAGDQKSIGLRAEVEGLRKDAARYRWLRDSATASLWYERNWTFHEKDADFDAAIDAAMKEQG